jgi:hypothetical protein
MNRRPHNRCRNVPPTFRRGTVYVLVLGISMMVLTLALGAVAVVRTQVQNGRDDADASDAAAYAHSAIEIGRQIIASDPNWRTTYSNGPWISNRTIGSGTFTLSVVNPNGALNNSPSDPILVTGTGMRNAARHAMQVTLMPTPQPLSCLQTALCAEHNIAISSSTVQHVGVLATNRNIAANSSLIAGDVEAAGTIGGGTYAATRAAGVPIRSMPDPSSVHSYYVANGTAISINIVPKIGGIATIDRRLFSPANNPFVSGAVNPQGIYYIDCGGAQIIVQNSRIFGTLVLLNAGPNSAMQGAMIASPAIPNYPTLLVKGDFRIAASGALNETGTPNVNINPPGTPYQGISNSTTTESYTSDLQGLYYISGALSFSGTPSISGVVVGGSTASISSTLSMTYSDVFYKNAPPGFHLPPALIPLPGSWTRIVE